MNQEGWILGVRSTFVGDILLSIVPGDDVERILANVKSGIWTIFDKPHDLENRMSVGLLLSWIAPSSMDCDNLLARQTCLDNGLEETGRELGHTSLTLELLNMIEQSEDHESR